MNAKTTISAIKSAATQESLYELVEEVLADAGINDEEKSWGELACVARERDDDDLAEILEAADVRWFDLM